MKKKILQKFGNVILKRLEIALESDDLETFHYYFEMAMWYEDFCEYYFGVELD